MTLDVETLSFPGKDLSAVIGMSGETRIDRAENRARIERSLALGIPSLAELHNAFPGETLAICGGGHSILDTIPELLELIAAGAKVCAVNKTHDLLVDMGIIPTFGILSDPKEFVAGYQTPTAGVRYLLCSSLHDATFARFRGFPGTYLWHSLTETSDHAWLHELGRSRRQSVLAVEGGGTTGLRALDLMTIPGFRRFHLFGFDSSAPDGAQTLHPYPKPIEDPLSLNPRLRDPLTGRELPREYRTSVPMAHQALQFEMLMRVRAIEMREGKYPPISVAVHGSGLIPDWAALRDMHHDPARAAMLRAESPKETANV